MSIRLITLGSLELRVGDRDVGLSALRRRNLALVAYLALEGATPRDRLVAMLWPGVDLANARHSLAQAIYLIKKELGDDSIRADSERIALAKDASVDARDVEETAAAERWERVLDLYHGPFLDGFYVDEAREYDDWQSRTRVRLERLAKRAFAEVIEVTLSEGDLMGALALATRWVEVDRLDDQAQHTLISLLAQHGDRAAALRQFESYRKELADELDVEPLEHTVELSERIRAGDVDIVELGPGKSRAPSSFPPIASNQDLRERLEKEFPSRLQVIGELGEGSMASVFLAREPEIDREVAVKVFLPGLVSDRKARTRFEREARSIASIDHRNVVTLYWCDTLSNGSAFIVLKHVRGRTLANRLRAEGRLSEAEARIAIISLAAALEAAHRRGIVHRDVHPGNLLREEETGRYLLSDFGFASIRSGAFGESAARITESGEMIGAPGYRSPEQLMEKGLTELSDIYGLGLIAYEILAGRPPYSTESQKELLEMSLGKGIESISNLRADVDDRWDTLVERCLAIEPKHRPSADDVVKYVRAIGDDTAAEPEEELTWFRKLARRRVPHFTAAYVATGFGLVELVGQLAEWGTVSMLFHQLTLVAYVAWFPAVAIAAWFHGRRGRQPVRRVEWWLYGAVAALWLAVSGVIVALA